jgi:hypothetical protein
MNWIVILFALFIVVSVAYAIIQIYSKPESHHLKGTRLKTEKGYVNFILGGARRSGGPRGVAAGDGLIRIGGLPVSRDE